MDINQGLAASCSSPDSLGNPVEMEINTTVANPIRASRNCIKKMLHNIDLSCASKEAKTDWAKIKGSRTSKMNSAHRRIVGKKIRAQQRSFKEEDLPPKEPFYGDGIPSTSCSAIGDDLEDMDRQFYESCRLAREAREEEDRLNSFFTAEYAFCPVVEAVDTDFNDIPDDFTDFPEPAFTVGQVLMAREELSHTEGMKNEVRKENLSYENLKSVVQHHKKRTNATPSMQPSLLSDKDGHLSKFVSRQRRSKDFSQFPLVKGCRRINLEEQLSNPSGCCSSEVSIQLRCGDLSPPVHYEDVPDKLDFSSLCDTRVPIPSAVEERKIPIPFKVARRLIERKKVHDGTVLFCPQGTGKSYVAKNFPSVIDSSRLPISFRNKDALRKIADSGSIVMTNRIRDCDDKAVYLIPDLYRYVGSTISRSLKTVDTAYDEYLKLRDIKAVKFKMRRDQGVADFLQYRMVVYRPSIPV